MGRDKRNEQRGEKFTAMRLPIMQTPAWRDLSATAQALYVWIRLEWKGPRFSNNGDLNLSVRQASERMGCTKDTAMRGFHDLQAKGFIVQTRGACLGVHGKGKAPTYELTEIPPKGCNGPGKQLFNSWTKDRDFPVQKSHSKTSVKSTQTAKACPEKRHATVIELRTKP